MRAIKSLLVAALAVAGMVATVSAFLTGVFGGTGQGW